METIMNYPILRNIVSVKVPTEDEAVNLIEELKKNQFSGGYVVTKSGYILKTKKAKGEIIESWYVVTCQQDYDYGE